MLNCSKLTRTCNGLISRSDSLVFRILSSSFALSHISPTGRIIVQLLEMWIRAGFSLMIGFGSFYMMALLFGRGFRNDMGEFQFQSQPEAAWQPGYPQNDAEQNDEDDAIDEELQRAIDDQRKMVRESMDGYEYPRGKYNISAEKLEDLLIDENGRPIRSIILTTWRTGSTFFGDIIDSHPGNFYHFEPLLDFDMVQVRGPPLDADAIKRVKALLNCDYTDMGTYIEYYKSYPLVFEHNTYLWKRCKVRREMCYNTRFLGEMCKLFPFQSMKLVRLRLSVAQHLLEDEDLNVRMVLLVRDPRGTLQSRKHHYWCQNQPDCSDPALLCADLSSDYKIAKELLKKYPTRFRVIRYEDLSAAPYERAEELVQFYGLDFHKNIKEFLDTHTKFEKGDTMSTFRDSKLAPYHWRTDLTFEEVKEIERYCLPAMQQWGYLPAMNETHQRTFNPVTNYVL